MSVFSALAWLRTTVRADGALPLAEVRRRLARLWMIILATSFAEAGGQIKTMDVNYPDLTLVLPDLNPQEMRVGVEDSKRIIGLNLAGPLWLTRRGPD